MNDDKLVDCTQRALQIAEEAWALTHRGLADNPMTRTAAIPATGILAAALLDQLDDDDATLRSRVEDAIKTARAAWDRTHHDSPGNPIAATAERSVIGILAAGILNHVQRARPV